MDDPGELLRVHALREGEHVFRDQLAGVRPDDRGAEELALRIGDDLRQPLGLAFGARAIDVVEREPVDAMRDALRSSASVSDSPTRASSGSVNVHQGTTGDGFAQRIRKIAWRSTMPAWCSARCVNWWPPAASPIT